MKNQEIRELIPILIIQNYIRPSTLQEAWELNQKKANRILGGMMWLRMSDITVRDAIDLSALGLDTIKETDDAFVVGAMVTQRQLETHEQLNRVTCGVLQKCVSHIVGVQFRNMATIGGSVWSRAGYSDVITALLALDTQVELYQGGMMPLQQFLDMPPSRDLLVRVHIAKHDYRTAYQSARLNQTDLPLLTCAAAAFDGQVRVAVGARPMRAMFVPDASRLLSGDMTAEAIDSFARAAQESVPTGSNARGSATYRRRLVGALVRRALTEMEGLHG